MNNTSKNPYGMDATSLVRPAVSIESVCRLDNLYLDKSAWSYTLRKLRDTMSEFSLAMFGDIVDVHDIIDEFFDSFAEKHWNKSFPLHGSTSFGGLFSLYFVTKKVAPRVVIESGVFVGASLHALRNAAPGAKIFAYDLDFGPLQYRDDSITYVNSDWMEDENCDGDGGLVFFDDHINNATRLVQARQRGLRYAIFDDAPEMGEINSYRYPGAPTIPMIQDPEMPDFSIAWHHGDNMLQYVHDSHSCRLARATIDKAIRLPRLNCLGLAVGHKWLVRLRRS